MFAPTEFNISIVEKRTALLAFIERINFLLGEGARVQIQFDNTKLLHPAGTLYFIASIHCLLKRYPGLISCNYPEDEVVEQLFQNVGLLGLLGNSSRKTITAENVKHWNFLTGKKVELSGVKNLFVNFAEGIDSDTTSGLFESMSEAVTNVIQHAYEDKQGTFADPDTRWWMFAQKKDGKLSVVVCDMGIGIPRSLKVKPELKEIIPRMLARLHKRSNNALIEMAIESSRSRTKLEHRGKGLPDMLKFAKDGNIGGFLIQSGRGSFAYNAQHQTEVGGDFSSPIQGTLIQWTIPLGG